MVAPHLIRMGGSGTGSYGEVYKSTATDALNWSLLTNSAPMNLSSAHLGFSLDYVNGKYVAVGGNISPLTSSSTHTLTNKVHTSVDGITWTALNNYPSVIANHATVVDGNDLYVIGGATSATARISDIRKSSDGGNTWALIASLPIKVAGHSVVVHDGAWFLMGGDLDGSNALNTQIYKSTDKGLTWTNIGTAPVNTWGQSVVVFNGEMVWLLGGVSTDNFFASNKNKKIFASTAGVVWRDATGSTPPYPITSTNVNYTSTARVYNEKLMIFDPYNTSNSNALMCVYSTTNLTTWAVAPTDIPQDSGYVFLITESTSGTPATLSLSGELNSVSTLEGTITVDTGVPPLETLLLSGQVDSVSLLEGSIRIVVTGDLVIQSSTTVNGVPEANVKVLAIRDTDNKVYSTFSNADGSYQIPVETEGYYHVVYLFKDLNNNLYSAKTHPYLYVGGV